MLCASSPIICGPEHSAALLFCSTRLFQSRFPAGRSLHSNSPARCSFWVTTKLSERNHDRPWSQLRSRVTTDDVSSAECYSRGSYMMTYLAQGIPGQIKDLLESAIVV